MPVTACVELLKMKKLDATPVPPGMTAVATPSIVDVVGVTVSWPAPILATEIVQPPKKPDEPACGNVAAIVVHP